MKHISTREHTFLTTGMGWTGVCAKGHSWFFSVRAANRYFFIFPVLGTRNYCSTFDLFNVTYVHCLIVCFVNVLNIVSQIVKYCHCLYSTIPFGREKINKEWNLNRAKGQGTGEI